MTSSPDDIPSDLRRRWSLALAGAGLFDAALRVHPALGTADTLRRGELAVLAFDHDTAVRELKELDGNRDPSTPPDPWLEVLLRAAKVMAGEPEGMAGLAAALDRITPGPAVHWVHALAAQTVGELLEAGRAAALARHGGCKDPRLFAIEAAAAMAHRGEPGRNVAIDLGRALELIGRAQHIALADEDPATFAADLLVRGGHREAAERLAEAGEADKDLPHDAREAWHTVARSLGVGRRRGIGLMSRAERAARRERAEAARLLICRCWGSTGWIGPDREYYVQHHLSVVVPEPVAGLEARLLRCQATAILFLDFPRRQITLPVSVGG